MESIQMKLTDMDTYSPKPMTISNTKKLIMSQGKLSLLFFDAAIIREMVTAIQITEMTIPAAKM